MDKPNFRTLAKDLNANVLRCIEGVLEKHSAAILSELYDDVQRQKALTAAQQQGQSAPPSAPVGVEDMQGRLDREESDHMRTIDQRDAAEDALGRMFQAVTGRPAEWSSAWGYVDAIEEVEEHVAALAQQPAAVDEAMVFRLAVWMAKHEGHDDPHHLIWEGSPPQPWGEVWMRYEDDARAALTAALATQHQEPTT